MQGKNCLFQKPDLNQRTPMLLFKKCDFGQVEGVHPPMNLLSQFNLSRIQPFNENVTDSFYTPPMERKSVPTPKAPVKSKKQVKKGDLRPKKLQYSKDELDISNVADSGIQSDQSSDTLYCKQYITNCNTSDTSQKIRRLRAKLNKIKVESNDKENDNNVVGIKSINVSNNKGNIAPESSVVFNPNAEVLSQYDNNLNWIEKLYWLHPRRDVGLWIECCRKKCKKWRYVEHYHDPVDVPKEWYCDMNSDKSMASCTIQEHPLSATIKADLIENSFNAGSIVWARVKGFPWWPGIVNDCAETFTYFQLPNNSLVPIRYYVTFFNEGKLECAWIHKQNLKSFAKYKYNEIVKKTEYHGIDHTEPLKKAYEIATNALALSILERLRRFSFIAQYKNLYCVNNNFNQSVYNSTRMITPSDMDIDSEDEIPRSDPTQRQVTLKEYYLKVLCKNQEVQ